MRPRPALLTLALLLGCAQGEPIGDPGDAHELGAAPPAVASEIFVEVAAADGRPIIAEAVWISVATDEPAPARCMESGCDTWIADVVGDEDDVTAYAQVCGFLYLEPLEMSGAAAVHVTVTADDTPCAPERVLD